MRMPADAQISPVRENDIEELTRLARDIWHRHYPAIITVEQIEYMLAQRYDPASIRAQLSSQRVWWDKLTMDRAMVGFASYELTKSPDEMKLDKLYVRTDLHGQGLGSRLIRHVAGKARVLGCKCLSLQVNKNNAAAIGAYRRNGFEVREAAKFDIGRGFYMDDYVMVKDLTRNESDS